MTKLFSKNSIGELNFNNLALVSALGFIFFSTVPFGTAAKNIFIGLMLLGVLGLVVKKGLRFPPLNGVSIGVFLLVCLTLISCLVSPYQLDSLNNFRKDTLPFLIAFVLLACQCERQETQVRKVEMAIWVVVIGFACRAVLAFYSGVSDDWNFSIYDSGYLPKYLDFFVADSIYFMPILLSLLFFSSVGRSVRWFLFILSLLVMYMVSVSGVRTSFGLSILILLAILTVRFRKWWRSLLICLILACGILGLITKIGLDNIGVSNTTITRYISLIDYAKYSKNANYTLIGREAIAKGIWEIDSERLMLGYGSGWKKLPTVANDLGFMDKWKKSNEPIDKRLLDYFDLGYGRVNPHNFYLMVIFEVGILGLLAYIFVMLSIFRYALRMKPSNGTSEMNWAISLAAMIYITVYLAAGISGGPWLPPTLLVLSAFVCVHGGAAWSRNP